MLEVVAEEDVAKAAVEEEAMEEEEVKVSQGPEYQYYTLSNETRWYEWTCVSMP